MRTSKISSSTEVAENAISILQGSTFLHQGQQVETSGSTLKCMSSAKQLNNDLFKDLKDPVPAKDGTVRYVDESGKEIAPAVNLTGNIGDFLIEIGCNDTLFPFIKKKHYFRC